MSITNIKCSFCLKIHKCIPFHYKDTVFCNENCASNYDKFVDWTCLNCHKYFSNLCHAERFYSKNTPCEDRFCDDCEEEYNTKQNRKFGKEMYEFMKELKEEQRELREQQENIKEQQENIKEQQEEIKEQQEEIIKKLQLIEDKLNKT